jgi:hypothetical protein
MSMAESTPTVAEQMQDHREWLALGVLVDAILGDPGLMGLTTEDTGGTESERNHGWTRMDTD